MDLLISTEIGKVGFGKLNGEMWIGNENIHDLTKSSVAPKKSELLINMRMKGQSKIVYAKYDTFMVGDEASKLEIGGPFGNASHSSDATGILECNRKKFSTKDVDNDDDFEDHCASVYKGGWWFHDCWSETYLNGMYKFEKSNEAIFWHYASNLQPEFVEMKIRRKN